MLKGFFRYINEAKQDAEYLYIIKNGGLVFFSQVWIVATNLILNYLIAQIYGANIVGIVALVSTTLNFAAILGLSGLNLAALKIISEHEVKYSKSSAYSIYKQMTRLVTVNSLVLSIITFFSADIIATEFFNKPHLDIYIQITALFFIPFTLQYFNESVFKAMKRVKAFAVLSISVNTVKVLALITLSYFISSQDLPVYVVLFSFLVLFIIGVLMLNSKKSTRFSGEEAIKKESSKKIRLFALPMFLVASSSIIISTVDVFILSSYVDESSVGVYYIASRLTNLITFMLLAINSVSAGKFSEYYAQGKLDLLKSSSKKATLIIFAFSLPVALIFIAFGEYILRFFGPEFVVGFTALFIISIGKLISAATGSVGWLLNMTGHQNTYCYIALIGGVISIVLNLLLVPDMGIEGAAISNMCSMIFINLTALIFVRIRLGFWNFFV